MAGKLLGAEEGLGLPVVVEGSQWAFLVVTLGLVVVTVWRMVVSGGRRVVRRLGHGGVGVVGGRLKLPGRSGNSVLSSCLTY